MPEPEAPPWGPSWPPPGSQTHLPPGPAPNTPWPGGRLQGGSGNPKPPVLLSLLPSFYPMPAGQGCQAPTGRPPEVWAEETTFHSQRCLSCHPSPLRSSEPSAEARARHRASRQASGCPMVAAGGAGERPGLGSRPYMPGGALRGRGGQGRGEGGWGVCPVMEKTAVGAPWPLGEMLTQLSEIYLFIYLSPWVNLPSSQLPGSTRPADLVLPSPHPTSQRAGCPGGSMSCRLPGPQSPVPQGQ